MTHGQFQSVYAVRQSLIILNVYDVFLMSGDAVDRVEALGLSSFDMWCWSTVIRHESQLRGSGLPSRVVGAQSVQLVLHTLDTPTQGKARREEVLS